MTNKFLKKNKTLTERITSFISNPLCYQTYCKQIHIKKDHLKLFIFSNISTPQSEQLYTQQSGERKDDFYERFLWNNGFVLPGIKALFDLSLPKMYLSTQTF